jgi:signal transduction histidine kinase/CheY-like chemotaxis protein/HPt (histidine-containing phosphotransfer) domain-containing protein
LYFYALVLSTILQQINYKKLFVSVRGKVITAFVTACVAVLLAWVVMHTVFRETLKTVDKLAIPNEREQLINRIFKSISKINQLQYVQYSDPASRQVSDKFIASSERLKIRLDSLSMYDPGNLLQQQRIDSMKVLISEHQKVYQSYVKLKDDIVRNRGFSKRIKQLSDLVTESSSKMDTNVVTSRQKITTVIEPEEGQQQQGERSQLASFIDKLFGKKKPKEDVRLKKTITEEYNIKVDTLSLSQQDSMLRLIGQHMGRMTVDQQRKSLRFIEQERELMQSSNIIVNRLFSLISSIREEEALLSEAESEQAASVISGGLLRLNIIMILFFTTLGLLSLLILFDISKSNRYRLALQEAKEEAERLTLVKQRFLANMSHELRTPLQSILGFAEQAHKQQTADPGAIEAIYRSSSHLLHIVNEVLDYSRITSGKFSISEQPFSMRELVAELSGTMEVHARAKSLVFTVVNTASDVSYKGDPFRLKQVLYNLLGNAIKFTSVGAVSLTVTEYREDDVVRIRFVVSDTGIGMSGQQLKQVFNEFEQADEQISTVYGGTGLGLSIVKELVAVMHGTLDVESREGKGTIFSVELPFTIAVPQEVQDEEVKALPVPARKHTQVWMADDDAYIRKVCEVIFESHHIPHRVFASGNDLLEAGGDEHVLYLLDIRMPGRNGFELCREIHKHIPDAVIIALTAQALPEEHSAIIASGFTSILTKPFTEQGLLQLVAKYCDTKGLPVPEFDLTAMKQYAQGNNEQLRENVQLFVEETTKDVSELKRYIAANNTSQVYELLHRLAGRVSLAGAKKLSSRLRVLERKLQSGQSFEYREILAECGHIEALVSVIQEAV